jgi:hypothetical protein
MLRAKSRGPAGTRGSSLCPRPAALLGFMPFAGLLPNPRVVAPHLESLDRAAATSIAAFPPDRAHVPFVLRASAPIYFRRGDRSCAHARSIAGCARLRLLGFTPVFGPMRDPRDRASILPWALPLAGLSGTCAVHRDRARPSLGQPDARSPVPGDPRPQCPVRPRALLSAHGFAAVLPDSECDRRENCSRAFTSVFAPDAAGAATPSLQRIDGADALPHPTGFGGPSRAWLPV